MVRREIEQFRPQLISRPLLQTGKPEASSPSEPVGDGEAVAGKAGQPDDHPAIAHGSEMLPSDAGKPFPSLDRQSRQELSQEDLEHPSEAHLSGGYLSGGRLPGAQINEGPSSGAQSALRRPFLSRLIRGAKVLGVPLVWAGLVAFCGGTAYSTYGWLISPTPVPNCDRIWFFSLPSDKLFCAEQRVRSGDETALVDGLKLVKGWPPGHYLHKKAFQLQRDWSKALLAVAREKALQNDLDGAIKLARQISPGHSVYRDAKNAVLEWEKNRKQIRGVESAVESALQTHQWQQAEEPLRALQPHTSDYWQQQISRLRERIVTERIAHNQLQQLNELVKASSARDAATLGRAINLAMQITPNRYTRAQVQEARDRWSQSLVQMAEQKLTQRDLAGAIAVAQWIPVDVTLPPDVRDLLWFHRAQQLSTQKFAPIPPANSLLELTSVLAAVRQISPNSPFYAQGVVYASQLEPRVQDLTQLQLAKAVADIQQIPSLSLAIQMAGTITPERPYRIYGQTLIASWKQDIQRAEDRPYLFTARQLAKTGKIRDLEAAIAQARRIPLGRALRPEAQAAIFDWKQQIQILEDKPLLKEARHLAAQGKLWPAIEVASRIAAGRALYLEAQVAIGQWVAKIQLTEDRPILQKADSLASLGDFQAAIAVASQIAPERVLYQEAQTAINRWSAKLAPTRKASGRDNPDGQPHSQLEDEPSHQTRDRTNE